MVFKLNSSWLTWDLRNTFVFHFKISEVKAEAEFRKRTENTIAERRKDKQFNMSLHIILSNVILHVGKPYQGRWPTDKQFIMSLHIILSNVISHVGTPYQGRWPTDKQFNMSLHIILSNVILHVGTPYQGRWPTDKQCSTCQYT